jgi:uncharacterized protein YecE (DUF72 family)
MLAPLFGTVEINSSFYRPANPRHGASWARHVADRPGFRFTMKLFRGYTHDRDAWPSAEEEAAVKKGMDPLAESGRLGAVLVQFPWSFKRTVENRQWLARIIETFRDYPLALEVRHASWDTPEVYESLARHGVAFCNIDQPLFGKSIQPSARATAPLGYVRLHGRNANDWFREEAGRDERYDYLYSKDELDEWIGKVQRIRRMVEDVYVVTNNHYRGQAVVNALEIAGAFGLLDAPVPDCLVEAYPRLKGLAPGGDAQGT